MYKHLASFGVEFFLAKRAPLTADDLCICLRDGRHEVWTMKDFPANELVICPFSTEIKERYWTYNRSALCLTDPGCKPLVLDGRLWTKVASDGKVFSVFWLIEQTTEQKDPNLKLVHSKLDFKMSAGMPDGTNLEMSDLNVSLPLYTNPADIPKHTRLVALEDAALTLLNKQFVHKPQKQ